MSFCQRIDNCLPVKFRRWFGLVIAIIDVFLFGGIHYGFNSLIHVYKSVGLFAYNCTEEGCMYNDSMFGVVFTVWMVSQMVLIVFAGIMMDTVGLRVLKLVAVGMYCTGCLMFGFTTATTVPLFYAAGVLVALGSICSLICNHQVSSMFPQFRGLCISLLSGAYDSSTVIAYVISLTYLLFPFKWSFIILAVGSVIVGGFVALFILTRKCGDMGKFSSHKRRGEALCEETSIESSTQVDIHSEVSSVLDERFPSLKSCILSLPYMMINIWFTFGLFRFSFYLSHLTKHINGMFSDDQPLADHLLQTSSAFFMSSFLLSPITGLVIDFSLQRARTNIKNMLTTKRDSVSPDNLYYALIVGLVPGQYIMASFAVLLSLMMYIDNHIACYAGFVFLVVVRSFLFSCFISFLLSAFPVRYFGTLNGISSAVSGLLSLMQNLFITTSRSTDNIVTLILSCVIFITPTVFLVKSKK
ncbi:Solute carrier family 43 member 3 [Schistosoma japonicum]|uniref:Solute carrier family 43 member 3 n=1 Tax=Schistosoma japonicum TaxID=6182 RepID=A0A4Z2D7V3_SCHJA|nr:Solute carrier family 43 member 3 [Schistosoma japonicum]